MQAKSSTPQNAHTPLLEALKRVEFWLKREGASRIIVAESAIRKLKEQSLPEHVCVIPKKRHGARKVLRGRRYYDEHYLKLAVWPEDKMDENALPSIACVVNGEADLNIADYVLQCRAGDWILFPAGVPKQDGSKSHFEGNPSGRSGELLWIYTGATQAEGLTCWICHSEGAEHYKIGASCRLEHRFLAQLFNGFCAEVENARRPEVVKRLLSTVLLLLRCEIEEGNALKEWGRPRYQGKEERGELITEALTYIDENLDQHLTIDKVARHILVSPATFTRRFKEQMGDTFQEYQTSRRLEVAGHLLKNTKMPIAQICLHVGLKYGQLWSLFQQKHGCSPSKFRIQ